MTHREEEPQTIGGKLGQEISRLTFESRELIEMFADVVEKRTGQVETWGRRVVAEIDEFRRSQGWSPDGFGGEDETPPGKEE